MVTPSRRGLRSNPLSDGAPAVTNQDLDGVFLFYLTVVPGHLTAAEVSSSFSPVSMQVRLLLLVWVAGPWPAGCERKRAVLSIQHTSERGGWPFPEARPPRVPGV